MSAGLHAGYPPIGRFLTVQGTRLHLVDLPGPHADAPTIVMIHGASGNVRDPLNSLGHRLNDRYRVITIDRPGHGHSLRTGRNQSDPRVQASLIADALSDLDVKSAIFVGHSWGGAVSAALGFLYPERVSALVFLTPATHPWPGGVDWHYRIGSRRVLGRLFAELLAMPVGLALIPCALRKIFKPASPPADFRRSVGAALVLRPASFVANCQDIVDLYDNFIAMEQRYCEISAPVEIVTGETDAIVAPAIHSYGLARDIEDASVTVLPSAGHMPHWTNPDRVIQVIDRAAERSRMNSARAQMPLNPSEPTKAMRSRLVAPGVPKGTPAVMMIRSPGTANSSE